MAEEMMDLPARAEKSRSAHGSLDEKRGGKARRGHSDRLAERSAIT
jgi:hypothetical protein